MARRRTIVAVFGLFVGCGEVQGQRPVDAPEVPPDMPIDAPDTPNSSFRYVVDSQRVPTSNTEARELGLDLNGDGTVDNQFGLVFGTLTSQGFDLSGPSKAAIDRGQILMLPELGTASFADDTTATFELFRGTDPNPPACANANDLQCRRHLDGTAMFGIDTAVAADPPLTGAFAAGTLTAGPGHLNVQFMMGEGAPLAVTLRGARVQLKMASDMRIVEGIIAGAVSQTELDSSVFPRLAANITAVVDRDCSPLIPPMCNCVAGSAGATMLNLFDTNPRDCKVMLNEIRDNTLVQSLFAPDITVEGMPSLSFGFGVTAVRGTFTPP